MKLMILLLLTIANIGRTQHVSKEERAMQLVLELQQLDLDKAKNKYDEADARYRQMLSLQQRGIITKDELKKCETERKDADALYKKQQIELENANLDFLENASAITVVEAQKYKISGNREMVRISIRNDSNLEQAKIASSLDARGLKGLLNLKNIRISVLDNNTQVGRPYEATICSLGYHETKSVQFELRKRGLDAIQLELRYLDQCDKRNLFLEKKSDYDLVTIDCQQFSQEGILGNTVEYDLKLERLAEDEDTYSIRSSGLNPTFRHTFGIEGKQITQVKFSVGVSQLNITMSVYVPETVAPGILDMPQKFYVIVAKEDKVREIKAGSGDTAEKLFRDEKIGFEKLVITPRGKAELNLYVSNMMVEIKKGSPTDLQTRIENAGTVPLDNVTLETVMPFGWHVNTDLESPLNMSPGESRQVRLRIQPSDDIPPGKYELQVTAECEYQNEKIQSMEKAISADVASSRGFWGGFALISAMLTVMVGITIFTVKVNKR